MHVCGHLLLFSCLLSLFIVYVFVGLQAAANTAETEDAKVRCITAGRECTLSFRALLELVHAVSLIFTVLSVCIRC